MFRLQKFLVYLYNTHTLVNLFIYVIMDLEMNDGCDHRNYNTWRYDMKEKH